MSRLFLSIWLAVLVVSAPMSLMAQITHETTSVISWSRGPDVPLPRGGYFAAWYNNGLWIGGGSYWQDGKKLWTNAASFYDPNKEMWSEAGTIPSAIGYGVTAGIGKYLYLLGGVDSEGIPNLKIHRLRGKNWSEVGETPSGFVYPAYTTIGSIIYILGGSTSSSDVTKATNEAWAYDTTKNKWTRLDPIPGAPRQIFSAAAVGDKIYVFGGVTQKPGEKFHNLDDAYRLDSRTGIWKSLSKLPQPMRAFWAGADGKQLYLIGGYGEAGLDTVYRYSPSADSYELVSRLPQPLMDTKFIFNNGVFYGASGEDKLVSRFRGMVIGRFKK
jgi:N-acetylneuraminic acid mutarotase